MKPADVFALVDRPTVVGTGLLALDVVLSREDDAPRLFAGGTCGNVLTILAWLGWHALPVARLGSDDAGRRVAADLRGFGVQLDVARLNPRAATPIIIERLRTSADGRPQHQFSINCPVCGSWLPRYQPVTMGAANHALTRAPKTEVFFFDRASRGALILAKAYAQSGALIVFEPSGKSDEGLLNEALSLAHICKYSAERFDAFRWSSAQRPLLEIQTLGHDGFRYRTHLDDAHEGRWQMLPALHLSDIRDAAGAGDWFSAGLIHQLGPSAFAGLRTGLGNRLKSALDFAQALAAWNCQFEGARGGMYAVTPAAFRDQILNLLDGQPQAAHAQSRMRSARLSNFRCPVSACHVRAR